MPASPLLPMISSIIALTIFAEAIHAQELTHRGLRASFINSSNINDEPTETGRILTVDEDVDILLLSQSFTFRVSITAVRGLIALLQLGLIALCVYHRKSRKLELAQPLVIGIMVVAGLVITMACFLFVYISNVGCAAREPVIFVAWSIIGATIAGRAWRISALITPVSRIGQNSAADELHRVERVRQFILHALTVLSGCTCRSIFDQQKWSRSNPSLRVQVSFKQLLMAITFMVIPSLFLQIIIVAHPALRPSMQLIATDVYGFSVGTYECKSMAAGSWPVYASIVLSSFPLVISYILNFRPKSELDMLPDIADERNSLAHAFAVFILTVVIAGPITGMSITPNVQTYATIAIALSLSISLCYYIAFKKLGSISLHRSSTGIKSLMVSAVSDDDNDGDYTAFSIKMAELYENIGRVKEAIQLVDETLNTWRKGVGNSLMNIGQVEEKDEVASGFTKNDLKLLGPDELQSVIHLIRIKARAVLRLDGDRGQRQSAALNVDALRIYENCPAASKLKDISIIFPVYNWVSLQLKGGLIEQDDEFSLEIDLVKRFCHEAQVQVYHYARSLASQAEILGRMGRYEEAFECFNVMKAVYMPEHHPQLLTSVYAVDRCALAFTSCALWDLHEGRKDSAIERCNFVIHNILPTYNKNDIIGLWTMVMQIIRVFKWNGLVDQALEVLLEYMPPSTENHFAVGTLYRPMILLLNICDESSTKYKTEDMTTDIELALEADTPDMSDYVFMADGWSMKSLAAEVCLHLARRMQPGNAIRELLVRRGLHMATVADQRIKASSGMIKHIMAFDIHSVILARLLKLANEDNSISRSAVHAKVAKSDKRSPISKHVSFDDSLGPTPKNNVPISNRLVVKDENSDSASDRPGILKNVSLLGTASSTAPSHVSLGSSSQVSSIDVQTSKCDDDSTH